MALPHVLAKETEILVRRDLNQVLSAVCGSGVLATGNKQQAR
jgi:hypothetical protein